MRPMIIQSYVMLYVISNAIIAVLYFSVSVIAKWRGKRFAGKASHLLWLLSLFAIVFATIILFGFPIRFEPEHIVNFKPLSWIEDENIGQRIRMEMIPNILIFIPFGIFTPMACSRMRKWYMTALVAFAVTFGIEFFQYFIGRSSDIDDVIANLLGGIIGYGVFIVFSYLFTKETWWKKLLGA